MAEQILLYLQIITHGLSIIFLVAGIGLFLAGIALLKKMGSTLENLSDISFWLSFFKNKIKKKQGKK
jgi:hypothetical protein